MGIEFLKYLLAASRVRIDCYTAENLHPNKSFHLCIEPEHQTFLNSSGKIYGCESEIVSFLCSLKQNVLPFKGN